MEKIVLVTGGNRGLGLQLCKELMKEGYKVILTARSEAKGKHAVSVLRESTSKDNINYCVLDITDTESIRGAVEWLEKEYNTLDVLVNNAAIMPKGKSTIEVTMEEMQRGFATNFFGAFQLSQSVLPLLARSNGRIINVSSGMGSFHEMYGGWPAYRISKTALNSLTAVMASDVAHLGIQVVAVCPGWVRTDMGGSSAPRSLEEGVAGIKWLINNEIESGKFYRDGKQIKY